jgi:membrane-associated phospholipid phosphatase
MKNTILITLFLFHAALSFSQNADINLLEEINEDRNKSLDPAFRFATNSITPMSIAIPAGFIAYAILKKDMKSKDDAFLVSSSLVMAGIISTSLKYTFSRDRPFVTYSFIDKETSGGSSSFPSGHTTAAFALATSVSMAYPKWYVIAPSFLWAGAVGYSRMDLGVHYPSDVLAGAIIGSGSAFLSYKLNRWINNRQVHLHRINQ